MRIAFYIPRGRRGLLPGPIALVQPLLPALAQQVPQYQWLVAAFGPRPEGCSIEADWIDLSASPSMRLPGIKHTPLARKKAWKKAGVDAIIGFDGHLADAWDSPQFQWIMEAAGPVKPSAIRKIPAGIQLWARQPAADADGQKASRKNVTVLPPAVEAPAELPGFEQKQAIKDKWTEGHEYFLCLGNGASQEEMVNLFKAFSLFKKRQHSRMCMLALVPPGELYSQLETLLKTYKFRADVVLHAAEGSVDELLQAAYALLLPRVSQFDQQQLLMQSMALGVPTVSRESAFGRHWVAEAGIHPDSAEPTVWAEAIKLLYKDETWRAQLVAAGRKKALALSYAELAKEIGRLVQAAR